MVCFKNMIVSFIIIVGLTGCSSKNMKELGGNMMTTGGGSPAGALVGVSLGGLLYGAGSLAEDKELSQKNSKEEKIDDNSSFVFESTLIAVKDIKSESIDNNNTITLDTNVSQ